MKKLIFLFLIVSSLYGQKKLLDDFESLAGWSVFGSDGVITNISLVDGINGKAIKFDYDFTNGSGYGGIRKQFTTNLPENFQFIFNQKAVSPNNNFEFKLVDNTGDNVWWQNSINYTFPIDWQKIKIKKRHISFAWGPIADQSLNKFDKIEFTIASYSGGKGSMIIDDLYFEELPPETDDLPEPIINNTVYDFGRKIEIGGLNIYWEKENLPDSVNILISDDDINWSEIYHLSSISGYANYIRTIGEEGRYIKLVSFPEEKSKSIENIKINPVKYSEDKNQFFINISKETGRGHYPRYTNEEASYWTIVGVDADAKEAMINEDGAIEVDKKSFMIEPFIFTNGTLLNWNNVEKIQSLENKYLPIPNVQWEKDGLELKIQSFASGEANKNSTLNISYELKNNSDKVQSGSLYLAIRPFQVNPYYQWLNIIGGVSEIKKIEYCGNEILVDHKKIILNEKPDGFGAVNFNNGEIVNYINENKLPDNKKIEDKLSLASGALEYKYELKVGESRAVYVSIPFYSDTDSEMNYEAKLELIKDYWEKKLTRVKFNLPPSADKLINTVRTNIGNILINKDGYGFQPGSRSYERSWIRDGALTSSALMKMGLVDEVLNFADWYTKYQFESGKVPCVVDRRGPDPVPENDSHGEFIYLIKQYYNYSKDKQFLRDKFDNVLNAIEYMHSLIQERKTDHYKNGNDSVRAQYGLLPESISHEGYSAKPMHSYWDDFWGMKGFKDAVDIAEILGEKETAEKLKSYRDEFEKNLYNSINLAMKYKGIDYIPGCAELGDFDATSTTIALYPVNEFHNLPKPQIYNTFNKYYDFFLDREKLETNWEAYTPYEIRAIGSFIFLDQPDRAHHLIDYFLEAQRPDDWNHWAEVVWKDYRAPRFIGDMPHTWVGSDFINAARALFIYENEYDSSLVIGAGLKKDWIDYDKGISIENLYNNYGTLSYSVKKEGDSYKVKIWGEMNKPNGGIIIKNFNDKKLPISVMISGESLKDFDESAIQINEFPAEVIIKY
ncbi:MAG: hypothetical protein M0P71_08070 [Melioribacteraceae bacterium]|nr:hypothetical protein [Melioribacteraceae bacterium]